jgi:rubredoxin
MARILVTTGLYMDSKVATTYRTWMCLICGFIYDEAAGRPEDGLAPGTRWEDVPPNWTCPECGARKEDFEIVEI